MVIKICPELVGSFFGYKEHQFGGDVRTDNFNEVHDAKACDEDDYRAHHFIVGNGATECFLYQVDNGADSVGSVEGTGC